LNTTAVIFVDGKHNPLVAAFKIGLNVHSHNWRNMKSQLSQQGELTLGFMLYLKWSILIPKQIGRIVLGCEGLTRIYHHL
jgi:hypothetical protein